ncbi:hypothetical protein ACFLVZ_00625 [Chloroflexota bacterium]
MSSHIIPEQGVTALDTQYTTSSALIRAERTGGDLAVSGIDGREPAGSNFPASIPQTNSSASLQKTCADTSWAILAECQNEPGKFFGKRIYCGKEWCPVCGPKRSKAHNRKIARILPKAQQIEKMGYFVIEFPDRYRKVVSYAYSKKALKISSDKIIEVLAGKRMGRKGRVGGFFTRGLLRWHWFGDKMTGKWNPHANVLVDGAYIEGEELETIKHALRKVLNVPDLIVHYSFAELPAQMFQKVEYITRATFLKYEWSPYMANQLWGFRNQRWWGFWKDSAVWSIDTEQETELLGADALEQSLCPDCGGKLVWTKPFNSVWLDSWGAVEIGETGYYRIPESAFSGHILTPADIIRLDKAKSLHIANVTARVRENESFWQNILEYMDDENICVFKPFQLLLSQERLK